VEGERLKGGGCNCERGVRGIKKLPLPICRDTIACTIGEEGKNGFTETDGRRKFQKGVLKRDHGGRSSILTV